MQRRGLRVHVLSIGCGAADGFGAVTRTTGRSGILALAEIVGLRPLDTDLSRREDLSDDVSTRDQGTGLSGIGRKNRAGTVAQFYSAENGRTNACSGQPRNCHAGL